MWQASTSALLLLGLVWHFRAECGSIESTWRLSRSNLFDFETLRSNTMENLADCIAAASTDLAVQFVAFNSSSGLCYHLRCPLGLRSCMSCRSIATGSQQVWTTVNECWTTMQHRVSGSVDFYRNWTQYQSEFGEGPDGNYWIGLDWLHKFTSSGSRKLRFLMTLWDGSKSWAEYSSFVIGPASDKYRLSVSGFSASSGVGDALSDRSNGQQFTTFDADNDIWGGNCAVSFVGAWWFGGCFFAHPNGQYKNFADAIGGDYAQGIIWHYNYGFYYSLKEIELLVL